ncbi:MAG: hypothetical protein QM762_28700 [Chryseolinea sp.]
MALGNNNPLLQKATGMLGDTLVFKDYDGKVVISKKPKPSSKPPSPKQLRARLIFKVAHIIAQQRLTDPEELERYKSIAKSRKSPNALTAARRDALRTIYADPSDFEELIAGFAERDTQPIAANVTQKNLPITSNAPANTFDALLASGASINSSAPNANQLIQQLADVTNALHNCLQELQKSMPKATELLQTINVLTASANERTSNAMVEQTTINNVAFIPGTMVTTKSIDTDTTVFVSTIDDATFANALETPCITSLQCHTSPSMDIPKHDHHDVDETPASDITTSSGIVASSILSNITVTESTAHINDRRQNTVTKSSGDEVMTTDFQRYYFPFPGIQQHLPEGMLDKIALIIQGNAPRVHYNPR